MIEPKFTSATSVTVGPVRIGFPWLLKPSGFKDENPKYSLTAYIPKTEKATVAALRKIADAAYQEGVTKKWKGAKPPFVGYPCIADGDQVNKNGEDRGEVAHGNWIITPKSARRPGLVDRQQQPIVDDEEVYGGMWCVINVTAFAYDASGSRGVAWALNSVMKYKDGDKLGGSISTSQAFSGLNLDDEDDDL